MNHSRNFSDWSRFFEYVTTEMPWPPSAAKRGLPPGPAGLAKKPVPLAFLFVAGLASAGKKAKKFMLIAASPSVIAWLFSRKNTLPQPGGVNLYRSLYHFSASMFCLELMMPRTLYVE